MPSITLLPPPTTNNITPPTLTTTTTTPNQTTDVAEGNLARSNPSPLPSLLRTPLGLAILEIQGSLNMPILSAGDGGDADFGGGGDEGGSNEEMDVDVDVDGSGGGRIGMGKAKKSVTGKKKRRLQIGRLEFPLLTSHNNASIDTGNNHNNNHDSNTTSTTTSSSEPAAAKEGPWTKKIHLFIGDNQRLTGELRKLTRPIGVVVRKASPPMPVRGWQAGENDDDVEEREEHVNGDMHGGDGSSGVRGGGGREGEGVELQIVDVVRWKLFFGNRPEFV